MAKKNKLRPFTNQQPGQPQSQHVVTLFRAASFSGPIPPPEMLRQYDEIQPGLAERIISMAEQQSAHRRILEKRVVSSNELRALIGQVMAFVIALFGIGSGVYLAMHDKPTEGLTAILGTLVGIVGVFVYGKMAQRKELIAKDRTLRKE